MVRGMKWVALFAGYATLGFSGDWVAGVLANEASAPARVVRVADATQAHHRGLAASDRCDWEVQRTASVGASADGTLRIDAGSGELRVEGRDGLREVRVEARACASDEAYLDALQVSLERDGAGAELRTLYPDRSDRRRWSGEDYARLDLVVLVPRGMSLDVQDSSGGMELTGTGALRIDDSSGDIVIRDAAGAVTIDDSSGGIDVRSVVGDVSIDDGSGGIEVSDVRGRLELRDGSGSIHAEQVQGDVVVADDGSGSIDVRDVSGDFRVRSDGSGGIRYSGVEGTVDIPRDKHSRRHGG